MDESNELNRDQSRYLIMMCKVSQLRLLCIIERCYDLEKKTHLKIKRSRKDWVLEKNGTIQNYEWYRRLQQVFF